MRTTFTGTGRFARQHRVKHGRLRFVFQRGWVFADVHKNGHTVRVFNPHLDTSSTVRLEQAKELLALAQRFAGPTIIAGDFNQNPDRDRAFAKVIAAHGFVDAFRVLVHAPGPTCCRRDLAREEDRLSTRVDLVLSSRQLRARRAERMGADTASRALLQGRRLWISDHVGVFAELGFAPAGSSTPRY